jgi:hypothetical protein
MASGLHLTEIGPLQCLWTGLKGHIRTLDADDGEATSIEGDAVAEPRPSSNWLVPND